MEVNESPALMIDTSMRIYSISHIQTAFFLPVLPPLYFVKHASSLYVWVLQQCHIISGSFHAAFLFSKFYLRLSLVIQTDRNIFQIC